MTTIKRLFAPPVFEDEDLNLSALLLSVILPLLIGSSALSLPLILIVDRTSFDVPFTVFRTLVELTFQVICLVAFRRGYIRLVSVAEVSFVWLIITINLLATDGVLSPAFGVYYLVLILSGLLLGSRASAVFAGLTILGSGVVAWVQTQGGIPLNLDPPFSFWITSVILFVMIAVLQGLSANTLRRTTRRAQFSEAQFRALFEQSPEGILVLDQSGAITLVNPAAGQILGYSPEALLGHAPQLLFTPAERAHDSFSGGDLHQTERTLVRQDGKHVPVLFSFKRMVDGRAQVLFQDITERKQAELALQESEEKFRTIFELAPYEIMINRMDGSYVQVNQTFLDNVNLTLEQVIGKHTADLLEIDPATFEFMIQQIQTRGQFHNAEIRVRRPRGEWAYSLASLKIISLAGEPHLLSIAADITALKQAQTEREQLIAELEAKNTELERFTYTVSHDLKSPIVTIKGFLGWLERDAATGDAERMQRDIQHIREAADKMHDLLNDLLELSRIGRLMNPPETISFAELVQEALNLVAGRIAERGVEIRLTSNLPTVYGDRVRLIEVLQNLVDNAVKFMGNEPQPCIEIGVNQEPDKTVFFVRDNGIGIEPRYQHKVFGLFERLDQSIEGTGIGLALVKRIIEVHGGRIWVESDGPGQGSTFYFTLPKTA